MPANVLPIGLDAVLDGSISHGLEPDVSLIVQGIARASIELAEKLQDAPLDVVPSAGSSGRKMNAAGDLQHPLDIVAHDIFLAALRSTPVQSVCRRKQPGDRRRHGLVAGGHRSAIV